MTIQVDDLNKFKGQALQWASSFNVCCYLDSNNFTDPYKKFDCLIAAGVKHDVTAYAGDAFNKLENFQKDHPGWILGFLSYDLKNELEDLSSTNSDFLDFPDLYFFEPAHLIIIKNGIINIISADKYYVFNCINEQAIVKAYPAYGLNIQPRLTKEAYVNSVNRIKEHIVRGDIYVTNFCQEFYVDKAEIDPLTVFNRLNNISPNPSTAYFKKDHQYILCASPERFLAKRGNKLISQPIKGTAKRGRDLAEDEQIKTDLKNHPKEQQENVMIVDLVRNDLTRSAKAGSVKTTELFGIYTFEHIFQMISTIECELDERADILQVIKNTFPMGSMTGTPKIRAMQLIEDLEQTKRGIYSGAIGYFSPDGDFDFNVIIRSILYNSVNQYLSFQAGSAITYACDPEKEYEECVIKTEAIIQTLTLN